MREMGDLENDEMGFQHKNEAILNCQSSGMNTNPVPMYKSSAGADTFIPSGWDPLVSLGQSENFGASSLASHSEFSSSYPIQYPSYSSYMVQKIPCFGSGNFAEMVGSFDLPVCGQISNIGCSSIYAPNKERVGERAASNGAQTQEDLQLLEEGGSGSSLNGKRRKRGLDSNSPFSPNKRDEGDMEVDLSGERSDVLKEQDEKKSNMENKIGGNLRGKTEGKPGKESSNSGEAPKENYIHVRARRGQATNSHSLAERVRREKISERMRLLQELVPGCNKITGKAVMLDEIINYVQSLQQQVEFLSMKLATVNPELNIDIDRILSKEILHSRGTNSIPVFNPGMSSSHHFPHGIFSQFPNILNPSPQFPHMPQQTALDNNELHSLLQMGFNSSSAIDSLGANGRLKPEL